MLKTQWIVKIYTKTENGGNFRLNFTTEKNKNRKIWICHSNPHSNSFLWAFEFLKKLKKWPSYWPRTEILGNVTLCIALRAHIQVYIFKNEYEKYFYRLFLPPLLKPFLFILQTFCFSIVWMEMNSKEKNFKGGHKQ